MSALITSQMRSYMINRQDAINAALAAVNEFDNSCNLRRADMISDAINNEAPSAQPEIGHWISGRDEDGWHTWLICSKCGAKETNLKAKYCPMCGRKMT